MSANDSGATAVADATPSGTQGGGELKRAIGPKLLLLFIIGDILGTGIYALVGKVAGEVGGAAWLPLIVAFVIALLTAASYLELVTKYPQAAGAALYTHKAFGIHFLTFMVAFTVMSSGITSASTAAQAFAENFAKGFGLDPKDSGLVLTMAIVFITLVAIVNFIGVSHSVTANIVLTVIELTGLLLVIGVGFWAASQGKADFSRAVVFDSPSDKSTFLAITAATSLAFFAMVGFEDSVNMAEETHEPSRIFPRIMFTGLGITAVIYVLVSVLAVAVVPVDQLSASKTPLVDVVHMGAPGVPIDTIFPFISMFAVANTALLNMLMASRLVYGLARQAVLPPVFGRVHSGRQSPWVAILFTTALAYGLITVVTMNASSVVKELGGTTALLLLSVFAIVNVAVLVLRKDTVAHRHFRTSKVVAVAGAVACLYFVLPITGRPAIQYAIAGGLLALGVLLWFLAWMANRGLHARSTYMRDPENLGG